MPGNVSEAAPTAVLPLGLCSIFTLSQTFALNTSAYKSGEYQTALLVENARRSWKITRRLAAAQSSALIAFYRSQGGAAQPFWYYDPFDAAGAMGSNWDATGTVTTGRYAVRFAGAFTQGMAGVGRLNNEFTLMEIA